MKFSTFIVILIQSIIILSFSPISAQSQNDGKKYQIHAEFVSIGSENLTGDLTQFIDSAFHWSMFNTTFSHIKYPDFHVGFTFLDFSTNKFLPNESEKMIIDSYEVVKTVTNKTTGLTTTTTEKLENIEIERMSIGLVGAYQKQLFKTQSSLFLSIAPTFYRFTSNLPSTDNFDPDKDSGIGLAARAGYQYLFKKNPIFLKVYYTFNLLPEVNLNLLDGMRTITGKSMTHGLQLGVGYIFE